MSPPAHKNIINANLEEKKIGKTIICSLTLAVTKTIIISGGRGMYMTKHYGAEMGNSGSV